MLPTTSTALAVILLAIVPGFVATTAWSRARTWKGPAGDLRTVLQSLAVSAVIQVLVSPLTILWILPHRTSLATDGHPVAVAAWLVLTVLVLPIVLGVAAARLADWFFLPIRREPTERLKWFRRLVATTVKGTPFPSTWDWLFANRPPNGEFVAIKFEDGSMVGGVFGRGGYALTTPEVQGLFLPQEWVLDQGGNFQIPLPGSSGLLIPTTEKVRWVRILGTPEPVEQQGEPKVWQPISPPQRRRS